MREKGPFIMKTLMVILISGLILTGCSTKVTTNPPENTEYKTTALVQIERKVHSETFKDEKDGTVLLDLKITYPEIKNPGNDSSISKINEYYGIQFDDFLSNILAEGLIMARADKEATQSGGYEFRPHTYERSAEIYYNGHNLLSVLNVQYENTGGAHPNSVWLSETFDVKTGKKLALTNILGGSREDSLAKVYKIALDKIQETKGTDNFIFQESYQENVRKNYAEEDFVLTGNSVRFYYQPYALAAYAAGFPVFELPYNQITTPALNIPVLPENKLEHELYDQAGELIDNNKEAYLEMFGLTMLKMDIPEKSDKITKNKVLFPVTDGRFVSYADFEQFVRNTYIQSEANSLLGNGRYRNVDGKLYGDISKDAGMGYYVDWNDYSYKIEDINETSATLYIFTTDDSPTGQKDNTITVRMYKENGVWLLEKMFG